MTLSLQNFDIKEADWETDKQALLNLRKLVFIIEQSVPPEEEFDGLDDSSWHWLVHDYNKQPIGTGRLLKTGQIGRMAVLEHHRGEGIGAAILGTAVEKARTLGFEQVFLNAQVHAIGFYQKAGFVETGPRFDEAGIQHQKMIQMLEPVRHEHQQYSANYKPGVINVASEGSQSGQMTGKNDEVADQTNTLGLSSQLLSLGQETAFRNVIQQMISQASQSVCIWSPALDHRLFHNEDLKQALSKLARKNRYTKIEILIYDSHRIVKNSHAILEIYRRLPSSISIKIVHPDFRVTNEEFVLVDNAGVILRQDVERYEGFANYRDISENNRLARKFKAAWETGLIDPNFRQLKI